MGVSRPSVKPPLHEGTSFQPDFMHMSSHASAFGVSVLVLPISAFCFQLFPRGPVVSGQWSGGLAVLQSHFSFLLSQFLLFPSDLVHSFPACQTVFRNSTLPPVTPLTEWHATASP